MTRERIKYMAEISNNEWDLREDINVAKQAITQAKQIATLSCQRMQRIEKRQKAVGLSDVQMKNLITEELAMKRLHNRFRKEANAKTKIYRELKKLLPRHNGEKNKMQYRVGQEYINEWNEKFVIEKIYVSIPSVSILAGEIHPDFGKGNMTDDNSIMCVLRSDLGTFHTISASLMKRLKPLSTAGK